MSEIVQTIGENVSEVKDRAASTLKASKDKPYEGDGITKQHVDNATIITQEQHYFGLGLLLEQSR